MKSDRQFPGMNKVSIVLVLVASESRFTLYSLS